MCATSLKSERGKKYCKRDLAENFLNKDLFLCNDNRISGFNGACGWEWKIKTLQRSPVVEVKSVGGGRMKSCGW